MALTERLALLITANADEALLSFDRLGRKMAVTEAAAKKRGLGIGAAFTGGAVLAGFALGEMVKKGVEALAVQQRIDLQTQAVLKSTGSVAGVTAKQVAGLAEEISHYSEFSIDAVKASENVLLSFTAVRDSAGAGNDIFDRATKAAADLSARFGTDLPTAARQLGRALQDPAAGMNALARSGVAFDAGTKEQIKSLAKQGQLLEAQKLLLDAVDQKVAGAARAGGAAASGGLAQLRNSFEEIDKTLAGPLLAPLTTGLHDLARAAQVVNEHPVALKAFEGIVAVGSGILITEKLISGFSKVRDSEFLKTLRSTEAHNANAAAIEREGLAANGTTGALERLGTAEALSGGSSATRAATTGGLFARFGGPAGVVRPALYGVVLGEVASHLAFGKGLENIPGEVKAHALGEQLNSVIADYNRGRFTFGQNRDLEALNPQIIAARQAAAHGDYSQLAAAVNAVNAAIKDGAGIYTAAAYAARQYSENLTLAADAADQKVEDIRKANEQARTSLAAEAGGKTSIFDDPNAKFGALAAKVAAARIAAQSAEDAVAKAEHRITQLAGTHAQALINAQDALAGAKTTAQVASAEQHLQNLRASGRYSANALTDAENNLTLAKERAALANDRLTRAEAKAGAAQGLSAKQYLANAQATAVDERRAATAAAKLAKAGVSPDVLDELINKVEPKAPGTLISLSRTITPAIVAGLNKAKAQTEAAWVDLMSTASDRALKIAEQDAYNKGEKVAAYFIKGMSRAGSPTTATTLPGVLLPFLPAGGTSPRPSVSIHVDKIVAPDPLKFLKEAQDLARLKALGGVLNVAGIL